MAEDEDGQDGREPQVSGTDDDVAEAMAVRAVERMRSMVRSHPGERLTTPPVRRRRSFTVVEGEAGADLEDSGGTEGATPAVGTAAAPGTPSPRGSGWRKAPGLAAGRTRWREPLGLGAALGRLAKSRGWSSQAAMGSVMAQWSEIVGPDVAAHCTIETFEERRLVVRCTSTAWAKQLVLLLPHIERRIAEEVGPGVVDQVVVRGPSAPSWRRGPRVVPGRGPRDTYG